MNPLDRAVAIAQVVLLAFWELLGAVYFGWSPLAIFFLWLASIVTLNVGVATGLRTYLRLMATPTVEAPVITEQDLG